ncbi:MAG TPA: PfkB family carbohydrate kinase [Verrucomicrobiae bacterium]|nr:PfkB family carbohydrate kinase [Verrucomicrobiae bacterium]
MPGKRKIGAVDVAGVGLNATDTMIRLPHFPALDSKVEILSDNVHAGGQVASAIVACRRWGLTARYSGKVGDDAAGMFQRREMRREGVRANWVVGGGLSSQIAYILVDEISGERTVLWKRDASIALRPNEVKKDWVAGAKVLLVDGHDTPAASRAAKWARESNTLIVGDFDNRYPGVEKLLHFVDYPIMSKDFPRRLTGERDLLKSLPAILGTYKCLAAGATLGRLGVIVWDGEEFHLCPGFRVDAVDTTGAGDVFHGAFAFGLVNGWAMDEILEFSCAAAALNCTEVGARGGIRRLAVIENLRRRGKRSERAFTELALRRAARSSADSILGRERLRRSNMRTR